MCFSYTWSAVAGVGSLLAGLSLIARKEHPRKYTICLFFSAMEFLQMWQYTGERGLSSSRPPTAPGHTKPPHSSNLTHWSGVVTGGLQWKASVTTP